MRKVFLAGALAALCFVHPAMAQETTVDHGEGLKPFPLFGSSRQVTSGTTFNPAISVIFDGKYYNDNVDGEAGEILEHADGFHGHHGDHEHGELSRGFNLGETELVFSASVDNYMDAFLNLAIESDGIEIEEAFGITRSLPGGLQLKFGKFFSGIGYQNDKHPHEWHFADQALAYQLLLGDHGLNDIGIQLTWLPELPVYTLVGVEAFQGTSEAISNVVDDAEEFGLRQRSGPRLFTGFLKVAPDLGFNHAMRAGLFGGVSRLHQEEHDDGVLQFLEGDTWFAGADLVYKYTSGKAYGMGNLVLQSEYIYREKDLELAFDDDPAKTLGASQDSNQDGFYIQGIYGFAPRWTAGARLDMVGLTNTVARDGVKTDYDDSRRYSAALTFNPTEFSRFRVQFNRGDIAVDGERERFNQVLLQYQLALGVHGAHKF